MINSKIFYVELSTFYNGKSFEFEFWHCHFLSLLIIKYIRDLKELATNFLSKGKMVKAQNVSKKQNKVE